MIAIILKSLLMVALTFFAIIGVTTIVMFAITINEDKELANRKRNYNKDNKIE